MCDLDVSAFDPVFWLHHTQVDRLGALWNYLNPTVKVVSTRADSGNYVFNAGYYRDDSFTYLPFRGSNESSDWWTPAQSYDVRASGYTYPEIADLPSVATLQSRVNDLYGNGRTQQITSTGRSKRGHATARVEKRQASDNLITPPSQDALAPHRKSLISRNGSYSEYVAECTIRKSVAPGTSFNFHLFFGDIANDLSNSDYLAAPNRVGGFSVAQSSSNPGANEATGIVPLTDPLLNTLIAHGIKNMKPHTVRKFVRAKLIWRLVTRDGQNIGGDAARHSGLQIKVRRSVMTPDRADRALPIVETPDEPLVYPADTEKTDAEPLPSGVAVADGVV
jgi:tyrosinase